MEYLQKKIEELEKENEILRKRKKELEETRSLYEKAMDKVLEGEKKFGLVFQNTTDAIFWADVNTGLIIECNAAAEKLLERSRNEIIGMHQTALHPSDKAEQYAEMFRRHIKADGFVEEKTELITKSGVVKHVLISATVIELEESIIIQGIFHDISALIEIEHALRISEERFRQVVENAHEWIWEIDREGVYTYSSPAVEQILGYKPGDLIGKKFFFDFFHPKEREELKQQFFRMFLVKKSFRNIINKKIGKDGDAVWLSTSGVPILGARGEFLGYRGVGTDITDLRRSVRNKLKKESKSEI